LRTSLGWYKDFTEQFRLTGEFDLVTNRALRDAHSNTVGVQVQGEKASDRSAPGFRPGGRIGLRQSLVSGNNRNASHPMNALLNYAYAMLESQVRAATVAAGLDPSSASPACRQSDSR
jgi:hypothetical protein